MNPHLNHEALEEYFDFIEVNGNYKLTSNKSYYSTDGTLKFYKEYVLFLNSDLMNQEYQNIFEFIEDNWDVGSISHGDYQFNNVLDTQMLQKFIAIGDEDAKAIYKDCVEHLQIVLHQVKNDPDIVKKIKEIFEFNFKAF